MLKIGKFAAGTLALTLVLGGAAPIADGALFPDTAVKASAANIKSRGTCGDHANWTFDDEGTLTITGYGAMKGYDFKKADSPFANLATLKKVVIGDEITSVGSYAFMNCVNLESVTLPDSIISVAAGAFYGCDSLKTVELPAGLRILAKEAFCNCSGLETLAIPEGVSVITESLFKGCTSLTEFVIPAQITGIGNYAFSDCTGLKKITIPEGVKTIGTKAFYNCPKLKRATLPASLVTVSDKSFGYLKEIVVEGEGEAAKEKETDKKFETFIVKGTKGSKADQYATANGFTFIDIIDEPVDPEEPDEPEDPKPTVVEEGTCGEDCKWSLDSEGTLTISGTGAMTDYEEDSSPFALDKIKKVVIGEGVTAVGNGAFCGNAAVTEVSLPATLKSIGVSAFEKCAGLTAVEIPEGTETIGDHAFFDCNNLTDVTVPASVTEIGELALGVYYNNETEQYYTVSELVIKGSKDSAAEKYANDNKLNFEEAKAPEIKYGDVNGDGEINDTDVALLQQFLADWKVEIDTTAADVTADGKVDESDIGLLQQYLADWKVTLGAGNTTGLVTD